MVEFRLTQGPGIVNDARAILIVANDAGGASNLAHLLRAEFSHEKLEFVLTGPARKIFAKVFKSPIEVDEAVALQHLASYKMLFTATSWSSEIERRFLQRASQLKIPTAAALDHWTNYNSRFQLGNETVVPNTIYVFDSPSLALAETQFPNTSIEQKQNYYWRSILEESKKFEPANNDLTHILYVTEPTSVVAEKKFGNPDGFGYTEIQAVEHFLTYLKNQSLLEKVKLRIRPHPSEPVNKYHFLASKEYGTAKIEYSQKEIEEDLGWSDWIVGCNSMVMAIGVFCKKRVLCSIPNPAVKIDIPFAEIERLF